MASGVRLVSRWALRIGAHRARSMRIASRRATGSSGDIFDEVVASLKKQDYDGAIRTLESVVSNGREVPAHIWNQLIQECHITPGWKRLQDSSLQGLEALFDAKLMFLGTHTSPEVLKDVFAEIQRRGLESDRLVALPTALERNVPFLLSELDDAKRRLGSLTRSLEVQSAAIAECESEVASAKAIERSPNPGWLFHLAEQTPTVNGTAVLDPNWWESLNSERSTSAAGVNVVNAVERVHPGFVIDSKKALRSFVDFRRKINDDSRILPQTWAVVCQLSHRVGDREVPPGLVPRALEPDGRRSENPVADVLEHYGWAYGPNAATRAIGGFVAVGDYEGVLAALAIAEGDALDLDAAYEALFGLCSSPRHDWLVARIRADALTRANDGELGPRFCAGLIRALASVQKLSEAREVASDAFRTHRGSHGDRILEATMSIEDPATACSIFEQLSSHVEVGRESLRAYFFALRHVELDETRQDKLDAAKDLMHGAYMAGTLESQSGDGHLGSIGNAYLWAQGRSSKELSQEAFDILKSLGENKTDETRAVIYLASNAAEHASVLSNLLQRIPRGMYDRTIHGVLDSMVANQWTPSVALLELMMSFIFYDARHLRDRLKVHLAAAHVRESSQTGDWAQELGGCLVAQSLLQEVMVVPPADIALLLETVPKAFMKEGQSAPSMAPGRWTRCVDYLTSRASDFGSWDYQRLVLAVQDSGEDVRFLIGAAARLIEIGVDPPVSAVVSMIQSLGHIEVDDAANQKVAAVVGASRPLEQAMYVRLLVDLARGLRPLLPASTTGAPGGLEQESQGAIAKQNLYRKVLSVVADAILGRNAAAATPVATGAPHEAEVLQALLAGSVGCRLAVTSLKLLVGIKSVLDREELPGDRAAIIAQAASDQAQTLVAAGARRPAVGQDGDTAETLAASLHI